LLLKVGKGFEVGAADELFFFAVMSVLEEDNIDVVEGSELLLDGPDELFVPDADVLSMFEVHAWRLGLGSGCLLSQEGVKKAAEQ
jgi:hypothetical protein